jgi:hypothetical protein
MRDLPIFCFTIDINNKLYHFKVKEQHDKNDNKKINFIINELTNISDDDNKKFMDKLDEFINKYEKK